MNIVRRSETPPTPSSLWPIVCGGTVGNSKSRVFFGSTHPIKS